MFEETARFDDNIAFWDLRKSSICRNFLNAEKFNQPIGFWDVSSVEIAFAMFEGARRFNKDISAWNWASIYSGTNPTNGCRKKRRARALLQQTEDEQRHSARLCGEENGLKQMFKNAPRFNGDVSRWKGDATTSEQENMFEGAGSFNTKWKCKTEFDGPTETCKERHESEIEKKSAKSDSSSKQLTVLYDIYMCVCVCACVPACLRVFLCMCYCYIYFPTLL